MIIPGYSTNTQGVPMPASPSLLRWLYHCLLLQRNTGIVPTPLIHLIVRLSVQESTETKHLHGLNVNRASKYSPKRFPIGLPLTFPIIHLVKLVSHSQHFPFSSKILCTLSQKSRKSWPRVSTSSSFPQSDFLWWFYNGCCYPAKMAITPLPHTIQSLLRNSCTPFTFLLT